MVDPCFISHNSSFQEVVTCSTIAIQKPLEDVQAFLFVQFFELLWDPSCTAFMEGWPVVDSFIGWTMTNLQLMCHFINSHPSVLQDHVTDLFCFCVSNGSGWASGSFLMLNACATILEPLDQFADSVLQRDTFPVLHWHPSLHFVTWYMFSAWKNGSLPSSVLWCKCRVECPCLCHTAHNINWLSRSHLLCNSRREVDHMYHVMPNQWCSQLQNIPILWIIFDLPSYKNVTKVLFD